MEYNFYFLNIVHMELSIQGLKEISLNLDNGSKNSEKKLLKSTKSYDSQVPSNIIFLRKMAQSCGVWQIKHMTSLDQDQMSMKSNMFGFRGYSQMKFYKTYKTAKKGLVWFGLVRACISC